MPHSYELSEAAEQDLAAIIDYTLAEFGAAQVRRYVDEIERQLEALAANPYLGRERDEIRPDLRSLVIGAHVLFYSIRPAEGLRVVRVLHGSRDLQRFEEG